MNEQVIKPLSMVKQEFIEQIVSDINNCKLPLFVIEYILQDILNTVKSTVREQSEIEKAQYEQQLNKQITTSSNKE